MIISPPDSLASVNERLMAEFEGRLDLATITALVRYCRGELRADATFPDLEVAARRRLRDLAAAPVSDARWHPAPCPAHWA